MTDAQKRGLRNWVLAIGATAVIMFGVVGGAVLLVGYLQGVPDAARDVADLNDLAEGQRELDAEADARAAVVQERSECISAWRSEWQTAIGEIVIASATGFPVTPAMVDRLALATRVDVNRACDPERPGGVIVP